MLGPHAHPEVSIGLRAVRDVRSSSRRTQRETVVMSFVEWPDKATRDAGMERVTSDPRMQLEDLPPTFDGRRLIAAGFKPMLDEASEA